MTTLRQSQALATRQLLLDVAAQLFVEHGFSSVTTTALCEAAGVTRGALYHHFAHLTEVMEAVFARAEAELVARVEARLSARTTAAARFMDVGPATLQELEAEPNAARIVFVEAPSALGWSRWRSLDGARSLRLVQTMLEDLDRAGQLVAGVDSRAAAQLVLGAINEAGMLASSIEGSSGVAGEQLRLLCRGLLTADAVE